MKLTLNKNERLKKRKLIDDLFKRGMSIKAPPITIVYKQITKEESPHAPLLFGVTVSKRLHKRAVDRNLIKRRMRESFRVNKLPIYDHLIKLDKQLSVMAIFTSKKIEDYKTIEASILKILKTLEQSI